MTAGGDLHAEALALAYLADRAADGSALPVPVLSERGRQWRDLEARTWAAYLRDVHALEADGLADLASIARGWADHYAGRVRRLWARGVTG